MNTIKRSSMAAALPFYTIREEIANSILHGIGALGAMAGLVLFSLKARGIFGGQKETSLDITAAILFASTMIGMFLISTLYHAIQHQGAKRILRKFDHSVIFVFIAGTYTPICLTGLRGAWGWSIFIIEWSLALTGIVLNILGFKALKKIEIAAYALMGWVIVVSCVPLIRSVSIHSVILIFAGGIAYTMGIIWYRKKHLKYTHTIWHTFVILGALCHWLAVWHLLP